MNENKKSLGDKITLPLSIIIAGLLIAGGIYLNGRITKENPTATQKLAHPPEINLLPVKTEFTKINIAPPPKPISFTPLPIPTPKEKNNEIFVKIDKFYSAKKALNQTKSKIEEIDRLLNKIRETKMREEQELSAWEKDLSAVKARIKEVTESIFEKIE